MWFRWSGAVSFGVLGVLTGCLSSGTVAATIPAAECGAMSAVKADEEPPQTASLEAQISEFLRQWIDAQNRRNVAAVRRLYIPCFDGPQTMRGASKPEWIEAHYLWDNHRQRVSLVNEPPLMHWLVASPYDRGDHSSEPTAWINVIVQRDTAQGGTIMRTALQLGWFQGKPHIIRQHDTWLNEWRPAGVGPKPVAEFPASVKLSCKVCPEGLPRLQVRLLRECERKCESATSQEERKEACTLAAEAWLAGGCGAPRDLTNGWKYFALAGSQLSSQNQWDVAWQLSRGTPSDKEAALRVLDCVPGDSGALKERCRGILFVNEFLWSSGNPRWMAAALENVDQHCPKAANANPCGWHDDFCRTAIKYIQSGKLGSYPPERVARYLDTLHNRPKGDDDECEGQPMEPR